MESLGRVPVDLVHETNDPIVKEVFERIAKTPVGVVNLHRTVANSPDVLAAFIEYAHALRNKSALDPAERELAIVRVLELHNGHYEARHHRKMAVAAGTTAAQAEGLKDLDRSLYSPRQLAILDYATAFAENRGVPPEIAEALGAQLDNRKIIELTLTLSMYLGLAHLTNALDVPVD